MTVKGLPEWQQISESVPDIQLYPYLLRLAVIANKQTQASDARRQEELSRPALTPDDLVVSRLPRGTLKSLMAYFKMLALNKQSEAVDPGLKRTFLAFYAQLLELKVQQPGEFEDLGQRAELLIVKFVSVINKVAGSASVETQGPEFVVLLRNIVRKNGGNSTIDAQLLARQEQFSERAVSSQPKKIAKAVDSESFASEISRIMLVSPTLFEKDLMREQNVTLEGAAVVVDQLEAAIKSGQHPAYQYNDFPTHSLWDKFASEELKELTELKKQLPDYVSAGGQTVPNLVPENVRAYYSSLIQRCIEADLKHPTLFSSKTNKVLQVVARYWRINSRVYTLCLITAAERLFRSNVVELSTVSEAYDHASHVLSKSKDVWPASDKLLAEEATLRLRDLALDHIQKSLRELFAPKTPKMGPFLQMLGDTIPTLALHWGQTTLVLPQQVEKLKVTVIETAENEYVRLVSQLPRDSSLDAEHILQFVQSIILVSRKLQNKYKSPLLDKFSIAKVVCSQHLRLLFSDFTPIWNFCMKQYESRQETPPFDIMVTLHEDILVLQNLNNQLKVGDNVKFDPESLLFPYFEDWAKESAKLAESWVKPAIEQDTNLPIDKDGGKMYSSAVKDLFSSFYSSISLIEKLHWQDQYHNAKLLTIVVHGISKALCNWASQLYESFLQEVKQPSRIKLKEQEEQWLAFAKEATAQATAAVMPSRLPQYSEPFDFKRESGMKLNNISVAYEMLHEMESQLHSDEVSKQIQDVERRTRVKSKPLSYLFTLTIIRASDIKKAAGGLYVTLVDQDSRKQVGKTSTIYSGAHKPAWNEPIELEVGLRPKLLKATVWSESHNSSHDLCGRAMIRLDPSQFARKEYGVQVRWIDLESGTGKLQVMLAVDLLQDDIRFHFGKSLRFLKRTQESMINVIVKQFSSFIHAVISKQTLREVTGGGKLATSVQSSVNQLQKSFNMWLGKSTVSQTNEQVVSREKPADDCLEPLYDYFNKNFATLAGILTPELRIEVLSKTWDVVLNALEALIIPPLEASQTIQTQLNSAEMEAVYTWLSSLRDFFHSDGAGPSLERLQSQRYQHIMAIPVYYDLPNPQLKLECEKAVKSSLRAIAGNQELMARQRTVMAHRNKSIIEHQASQLHNAQRTTLEIDDVILRILRLRGEYQFIEQQIKVRERLLQRELTERALQGSFF